MKPFPHDDIQQAIEELRQDRISGATSLAARGLDIIERLGRVRETSDQELWERARDTVRALETVKPAMASIGAQAVLALGRARRLRGEGLAVGPALVEAAQRERDTLGQADDLIASYAAAELSDSSAIVTCSFSATALKVIVALRPAEVWTAEGGRLRDGARGAAWLAARGLQVSMVPDESLPGAVERAAAVIVGADQILVDGALVNRAGTLGLGLAASYFGKPLVVVCHRFKLTGRREPVLEQERSLLGDTVPHVRAVAPLFDVTPAGLVHAVVTESGTLSAERAGQLGIGLSRLRAELLG